VSGIDGRDDPVEPLTKAGACQPGSHLGLPSLTRVRPERQRLHKGTERILNTWHEVNGASLD
jgi:hypothetical protein